MTPEGTTKTFIIKGVFKEALNKTMDKNINNAFDIYTDTFDSSLSHTTVCVYSKNIATSTTVTHTHTHTDTWQKGNQIVSHFIL